MKKVLFIDYITTGEHADYNNIQINHLCELGLEIDVCSIEDSFDLCLFQDKINRFILIPKKYCRKHSNRLEYALFIFKRLNFIKEIVDQKRYDYIVFSSYIAFFHLFYKFRVPVFLVNHYNLAFLDNRRLLMLKYLSKNYGFISLCEPIERFLLQELNIKTIVVKHGLFLKNNISLKGLSFNEMFGNYVFMPASASLDEEIIKDILHSKQVASFLIDNSLKLIIKGKYQIIHENIIVIDRYLSHEEYHNMFYNAKAIILPYNKYFIHRVSATLLESITYNIPCLLTSEYLCNTYNNYFMYEPFFDSSDKLVRCLQTVLSIYDFDKTFYKNTNLEKPDWSFLC